MTENTYKAFLKEKDSFPGLSAVKTLIKFIDDDKSSTLQEFFKNLKEVQESLKNAEQLIEVDSYMAIFIRFSTLNLTEFDTIEEQKGEMKKKGNQFLNQVVNCKQKVAKHGHCFISDGSVILVNSESEAVYATLCEALANNKRFTVYVIRSALDNKNDMLLWLQSKGITSYEIVDSAIGFFMEKVDLVLSGAQGVMENGGIINKIGTFPLALCAKAMNKPFYVSVESFKFARLYPLNQADIPDRIKYKQVVKDADKEHKQPVVDYTPPSLITLLLTNLGPLTTAAVSDVLMTLYL